VQDIISTDWLHLGTAHSSFFRDSKCDEASTGAPSAAIVAEALDRVMPGGCPGYYSVMAQDIANNSASQSSLLMRLFLLSNNFQLSHDSFSTKNDAQISILVAQINSAGLLSLVNLLSKSSYVVEAIKDQIFAWALRNGCDDIVRLLLKLGCDPDSEILIPWYQGSPLEVAARFRDKRTSLSMIHTLLEYGAKVESRSFYSALDLTIITGNQEAAAALREAGARLTAASLLAAIQGGDEEMVQSVLDTGVDINSQTIQALGSGEQWPPLTHAAHRGLVGIVRTLVARGADVNALHRWHNFWTTALGVAVAAEQIETTRFLITEMGAVHDQTRVDGYVSPLSIACLVGNPELITLLLNAKPDVTCADTIPWELSFTVRENVKMPINYTATTLLELLIGNLSAGEVQLVDICAELITKGARVDKALVAAVDAEKIEVVKLLIRHGAPLGIQPELEKSAFGLAIEIGNLDLAQILHDAGATEVGFIRTIKGVGMIEFLRREGLYDEIMRENGWVITIRRAIEEEEELTQLAQRIVELDLTFEGRHHVLEALLPHACDADLIRLLIDRGARCGSDCLNIAIQSNAPDSTISLLLERILRRNEDGLETEPISAAVLYHAVRGSPRIVRTLLQAVTWTPDTLGSALTCAINHGNYDVVEDLLHAGAAVNGSDSTWELSTPLTAAIYKEQEWLVRMLIREGADLNAHVGFKSPLVQAVKLGNMVLVEILLGEGADPNPQTVAKDLTALQLASCCGDFSIARRLIEAGADVNAPGKRIDDASDNLHGVELTALTLAASKGRLEILNLLLRHGAAVDGSARIQYIDAIRVARCKGHKAAASLLISHGGWAEADERTAVARDFAAATAMRNHWKAWRAENYPDEPLRSRAADVAIIDSGPQPKADCSDGQGCEGDVKSVTSNAPEGEAPELEHWLQGWEMVCGNSQDAGATMTDFDDFFCNELRMLEGL